MRLAARRHSRDSSSPRGTPPGSCLDAPASQSLLHRALAPPAESPLEARPLQPFGTEPASTITSTSSRSECRQQGDARLFSVSPFCYRGALTICP
jgi:hypothetical protein